jgi:hypothetical protein
MEAGNDNYVMVRLEHPNSIGIAVFEDGKGYSVTLGNILDADAVKAKDWLLKSAMLWFGSVRRLGILRGSVDGRREVFVTVDAKEQSVLDFVKIQLRSPEN